MHEVIPHDSGSWQAIGGAVLADSMFAAPVLSASHKHRGGAPILLSEVVATAGLLLLIVTLAGTGRTQHAACPACCGRSPDQGQPGRS